MHGLDNHHSTAPNSGRYIVGGSQALEWLMPGLRVSSTILEAVVSYSRMSLIHLLGKVPTQITSRQTVEDMALMAYNRARKLFQPGFQALSISFTLSPASSLLKHGNLRFIVSTRTSDHLSSSTVSFSKANFEVSTFLGCIPSTLRFHRRERTIKSSHGLYQNQILKIARENSKAFKANNWVAPDCCRALVVDPDLLLSVITSIRHQPRVVLKIFGWAEAQKGFKHSDFVFCSVLEILVENDFMSPAYRVVERVIDVKLEGVVDILIDGYSDYEVSLKILDLILWVCTKKSDVERCLCVFDKMVKNGFLPDVKNCNRILRVLRDMDLDGKARELYVSMGQFGIEPTIVTHNTMLDIFCRHGNVQQALNLLREMKGEGWNPNDVTYNVLIDGLSKKGEIEKAKELFDEMSNTGLKLSVYSYNSLISGYCDKGMLVEAISLEEHMEIRGTLPNVSTYNALMHGYCKQGRVGCAMQWIPVMLKKNIGLDAISYNTMIHGYCLLGDANEAVFLLSEMRKDGINPTTVTFNIIIDGLSKIGVLEGAKQMKNEMKSHGISPDIVTYTILISNCYKTGRLSMAKELYDEMLQVGLEPDFIAYATCIAGELKFGNIDTALILQQEMLTKASLR